MNDYETVVKLLLACGPGVVVSMQAQDGKLVITATKDNKVVGKFLSANQANMLGVLLRNAAMHFAPPDCLFPGCPAPYSERG